ncbi:hypothetical protein CH63R_04305 [Colletotrichum higginsianum IMI 349063]|uniref:Uncharacterized protein n=1 Tax=Colletotrichum higginsianum (strain IMI 349063) TaxID=759273 RepID=A0A1B7YIT5_COLHI|nr:hypothetical protein CH63R_04305 [Colletotrichum higginsianum IMI 349063]OBR12009.1 hypothetical protein CH63R_04305 [Colletotrichum higginsianum IMI 349063]
MGERTNVVSCPVPTPNLISSPYPPPSTSRQRELATQDGFRHWFDLDTNYPAEGRSLECGCANAPARLLGNLLREKYRPPAGLPGGHGHDHGPGHHHHEACALCPKVSSKDLRPTCAVTILSYLHTPRDTGRRSSDPPGGVGVGVETGILVIRLHLSHPLHPPSLSSAVFLRMDASSQASPANSNTRSI